MSIAVFLGPTLSLERARALLPDAEYLPPAKANSVKALVRRDTPPRIVVLIDGIFHMAPAVRHKEILAAMSEGITVIGAASMGALRAAELARYGMIGVGSVYAQYATGAIEDDDEVAVSHLESADGSRALTVPMVTVRHATVAAAHRGLLTHAEAAQIGAVAKAVYFADRTWPHLYARARVTSSSMAAAVERFRAFVEATTPDVKRDDAELALAMAQRLALGERRHVAPFTVHHTVYSLEMCKNV